MNHITYRQPDHTFLYLYKLIALYLYSLFYNRFVHLTPEKSSSSLPTDQKIGWISEMKLYDDNIPFLIAPIYMVIKIYPVDLNMNLSYSHQCDKVHRAALGIAVESPQSRWVSNSTRRGLVADSPTHYIKRGNYK